MGVGRGVREWGDLVEVKKEEELQSEEAGYCQLEGERTG